MRLDAIYVHRRDQLMHALANRKGSLRQLSATFKCMVVYLAYACTMWIRFLQCFQADEVYADSSCKAWR